MDFMKQQFDKLLLAFFMLAFGAVHVYLLAHGKGDDSSLSHAFDAFSGALLGLITGLAVGRNVKSE